MQIVRSKATDRQSSDILWQIPSSHMCMDIITPEEKRVIVSIDEF